MGELYTKMMAYHIGGQSSMTEAKIRALSAMVDSLEGYKFSWESWFVAQLHEEAMDF